MAAPGQTGAVAAMRALPSQYQNGILRLSADHGKPTPPYWAIIARNPARRGLPTSLTVARGRVTSERATLNPRALISGDTPITLSKETKRRRERFMVWNTSPVFYPLPGWPVEVSSIDCRDS